MLLDRSCFAFAFFMDDYYYYSTVLTAECSWPVYSVWLQWNRVIRSLCQLLYVLPVDVYFITIIFIPRFIQSTHRFILGAAIDDAVSIQNCRYTQIYTYSVLYILYTLYGVDSYISFHLHNLLLCTSVSR